MAHIKYRDFAKLARESGYEETAAAWPRLILKLRQSDQSLASSSPKSRHLDISNENELAMIQDNLNR